MGGAYEIAPPRRRLRGLDLRELWSYRELAWLFALRGLRLRYRQTFLGIAWALLQPLTAALVFTFVFGEGVGLSGDGAPYSVFVLSGLILWQLFGSGTQEAAVCLVDDRELVTRVWFPRLLAPLGAVVPGVLDLLVGVAALAVLMAIEGVAPGIALVAAPAVIAATVALALGAGSLLCTLNVRFRDVKYSLGFALQVWFFFTPVVYASSVIDGVGRWILAANPLCGAVDAWRWAVIGGPAPPHEDLLSLAVGVVVVAVGLLYFRSAEGRFADVI